MLKKGLGLLSIIAAIFLMCASGQAETNQKNKAVLLTVKSAIGPATQDYLERGFKKAEKNNASLIILQLDTPGGLSESMRGIIRAILASPIPVVTYVAPSGARAASAGTYILYASPVAAMAPGTNLGAATPVSIGGPGSGDKGDDKKKSDKKTASEKKAINDARAYIRGLAQLRGRNVAWAEKAVVEGESLSAQEALKLNVIDVIAKDIPTLLKKINGKTVLVNNQKATIQSSNLIITKIEPNWRSRFLSVITNPSVAYILLMIGFYGLLFEFINPGFVIPGVAGGICLLVALYALQLLPISYAGLGLIVLGLAFVVAEAFLPSFGALGIGGIIAFVIGSVLLVRTDEVGFQIPWGLIAGVAASSLLFCLGVLQFVLRSRRRPIVSGAEGMIGTAGVIVLRSGTPYVKVSGEFWQLVQDQTFKEGEQVRVEAVEGLHLRVKKQKES